MNEYILNIYIDRRLIVGLFGCEAGEPFFNECLKIFVIDVNWC